MDAEKQDLFNSLSAGFNITPTQGEMDDFLTALDKNGLKLVSIHPDCNHENSHFEDWPDGGSIEICICGMSRHHTEFSESNWTMIKDIEAARKEVQSSLDSMSGDCREIKTRWRPISEMKENNDKEYRLLDENNIVGVGHQEDGFLIVYNLDKTPAEFGRPEMFAEIKPPEVPV